MIETKDVKFDVLLQIFDYSLMFCSKALSFFYVIALRILNIKNYKIEQLRHNKQHANKTINIIHCCSEGRDRTSTKQVTNVTRSIVHR